MASQTMNAKQQQLLEQSAQGLRNVLRQLRNTGVEAFSEEDSEGGEGPVGPQPPTGNQQTFGATAAQGKVVSEDTIATLATVLGHIDEVMREVQSAAFSSTNPSEAMVPQAAHPSTVSSGFVDSEHSGVVVSTSIDEESCPDERIPSICVETEIDPRGTNTYKGDPRASAIPALTPKSGAGPSLLGDVSSSTWASPFDAEGESVDVDEDVAQWLTNTYAADYHRENTGFEVRLARGRDSVVSIAPPADMPLSDGAPSPTGSAGRRSIDESFANDAEEQEDFFPKVKPAKYARKNTRSHNAFCSTRRLHQSLKTCNIEQMNDVNDPSFDIFEHHDQLGDDVFTHVCLNVLLQYNFVWSLQLNVIKLHRFLKTIQGLYQGRNPYHNACHAADVLQTTNVYLCSAGVKENFSDVELLAVLFSALTHDVGHVGINNAFLINTRHPIARLSNDRSPLESLHVMLAFEVLELEECNFFAESLTFKKEHFDDFRGLVVHGILGTDMKFHTELIKTAHDILEDGQIDDDEVRDLFRAIIHAADLSNPMKPKHIYLKWADRVVAEFWQQGDEERRTGQTISMMCDRNGANIAKSQLGFINFIVKPFMTELSPLLPPVWLQRLNANAAYMEQLTKEEEAERIAAIGKLSESSWQDMPESQFSYHSVVNRLLKADYKAKRGSREGGLPKGPGSTLLANHLASNPAALSPLQAGGLTPNMSNTSFFAGLEVKAQLGQRESQYLQVLVNVTDDLISRIAREGKEDRRMISRRGSKKVSFTGSENGQTDANDTSLQALQSNGSGHGDSGVVTPPSGRLDLEALSQEWITALLEIQLKATEQAQQEKGTSALSDVDLLPHAILKPHLKKDHDDDLLFEVTPEIIGSISEDGPACVSMVKQLAAAAGNTSLGIESPKIRVANAISFCPNEIPPTQEDNLITREGPGSSLRTALCKLTHMWLMLFLSEQSLTNSTVSRRASTPTSPEGGPQIGITGVGNLQVLNTSGTAHALSGPTTAPTSTISSSLDAPAQPKKHSSLVELLSGHVDMGKSNTSWSGSVSGAGNNSSTTGPQGPHVSLAGGASSTSPSFASTNRWTEPTVSATTNASMAPETTPLAVTRGYVLRTRTVEQNRSSWNATLRSVDQSGSRSPFKNGVPYSNSSPVGHPRDLISPVLGGNRSATTSPTQSQKKTKVSSIGRPGDLMSSTPEPTVRAKTLPPL